MAKKPAHHGGAWKVAYADFVTAMMALFMVLWISAQDPKIVFATSEYFNHPFAAAADATSGVLPFNNRRSAVDPSAHGEKMRGGDDSREVTLLNSVAADFYRLLNLDENVADKPIDIEVSGNGLLITLYDRGSKPLFVGNTARLTAWGEFVLQNMAWVIDHHRFRVVIEGHTRSGLALPESYTAWELSSDRALAARRALVHYAVDPAQVDHVAGFAATRPLANSAASAESNERITLSLTLATAPASTAPGGRTAAAVP